LCITFDKNGLGYKYCRLCEKVTQQLVEGVENYMLCNAFTAKFALLLLFSLKK
jgi:hypothetical protein